MLLNFFKFYKTYFQCSIISFSIIINKAIANIWLENTTLINNKQSCIKLLYWEKMLHMKADWQRKILCIMKG